MENYRVQEEENSIDLLEIFEILRQNLWIIVMSTVTAAVIGFVTVYFFATPMYEARASMIVNSRQDGANTTITTDQINSASKLVATYRVIIRSSKVLQPVIDQLGLEYTPEQLAKMVTVSAINDTPIMNISVTSTNPQESYRICSAIMNVAPDIVKETVDAGSAKMVSETKLTDGPVSPHIGRDTAIMGIFGAILSMAIIIVIHLFDNKINNEADVAKYLDMTVLGVIPLYEKEKK